jgi:signal transduction histidine kinase
MIWDWLRRHPLFVDLGLVALILVSTIGAAMRHPHTTAGVMLGSVETLPLLRRRQWPVATVVSVAAVAVLMVALGVWLLPFQLGIALYTLAAVSEQRNARVAGLSAVTAVAIALLIASGLQFGDQAARVVFLIAAWLLGDSIGSRRAYVREIEQKAARLEQERETQARRAVAEEQARIARELHDIVAHALSVIVVQAAAAGDVFDVDPRRAREPILAIESAARAALGDLRRVLGILHGQVEYEPQPGLALLDRLIEQVRATGLDVTLEIEGAQQPLPITVDLSAYRIVQEALTNTLKHSGAEHVKVRVRYGRDLDLEVHDDGRGANSGDTVGSGLIGMRERVAMLGGRIETGPAQDGGYLVSAHIPINGDR